MQYKTLELKNHPGVTQAWQPWPDLTKTFFQESYFFCCCFPSISFLIKTSSERKIKLPRVIWHPTGNKAVEVWTTQLISCVCHVQYRSAVIELFWNARQVLLRQRQAAPRISAASFCMINFCLSQFLRNCLSFGRERSKVIKAEDKFTVILRKWNKIACYSKSCLS